MVFWTTIKLVKINITNIASKLAWLLALLLLLLALLVGITKIFSPQLQRYVPSVETILSERLQHPVVIKNLTINWKTIAPTLELNDLSILNETQQPLLKVRRLGVQMNLWRSLLQQQWVLHAVNINGSQIILQEDSQGYAVVNGFPEYKFHLDLTNSQTDLTRYITALLNLPCNVTLKHIDLTWQRPKQIIILRDTGLKILRQHNSYQISGYTRLSQPELAIISLNANLCDKGNEHAGMQANVILQIKNLQLQNWLTVLAPLYPEIKLKNGLLTTIITGFWNQQHWQKLGATFNLRELIIGNIGEQNHINRFAGYLAWRKNQDKTQLDLTNVELTLNNQTWPVNELHWQQSAVMGQFLLQHLQLDLLSLLANNQFLPNAINKAVLELKPNGSISDINLSYSKPINSTDFNKFTLKTAKANFTDLNWQHWYIVPGVTGLSGTMTANPDRGEIVLNSNLTDINFGHLFRAPLKFNRLTADITWQKLANTWNIEVPHFFVNNPDLSARGQLNIKIPDDKSSPTINMETAVKIRAIKNKSRYFPVSIMSPSLVTWLDTSIIDGDSADAQLTLRGPLTEFPFIDGNSHGLFLIDANVKNIDLAYQAGWPNLTQLSGKLVFVGHSMMFFGDHANLLGIPVTHMQAIIPNMYQSLLQIGADLNPDLAQAQQFIQNSPLKKTIGQDFVQFNMQGATNLALRLMIPLENEDDPVNVSGSLDLLDDNLVMPNWNIALTKLHGNVKFTEESLTAPQLTADWLDQLVNLNLLHQAKSPYTSVELQGNAKLNKLADYYKLPDLLTYAQGAFNYRVQIQLPQANSKAVGKINIGSDLQGLALKLPIPLGKSAATKLPVQMTSDLATNEPLAFILNYGNRLSAAGALQINDHKQWQLLHTQVQLGGANLNNNDLPATGVQIKGNLDEYNLEEWLTFFKHGKANTTFNAASLNQLPTWLSGFDVSRSQWQLGNQNLTNVRAQLNKNNTAWLFAISSEQVQGRVIIPQASNQPWQAQFDRMYLTGTSDATASQLKPNDVPALIFKSNNFHYNKLNLGTLEFTVTPVKNLLILDRLTVKSPDLTITAQGNWVASAVSMMTAITGKLVSKNLAAALKALDLPELFTANKAEINFNLNWPNSPPNFALADSNGIFKVQLRQGEILDVGNSARVPIALGRLLNLLSVQSLMEHLQLSFRDFTDQGFNFDSIQGNFHLTNGNLLTQDTVLQGPIADLKLLGRIGLSAKDFDMTLQITPHLTSSLPVAAGIAGGPLVGALAWVAEKVVSLPMNAVTTRSYTMKGPWEKPIISGK